MTPLEIIKNAQQSRLIDEDNNVVHLETLPGLNDTELESFQRRLQCGIPSDIQDLLRYCRGFTDGGMEVDFTDNAGGFEMVEVFPHGLPIAADGFGNYWVVDLWPDSTTWGPIYFACHDAPVILYQGPNLEHFLTELFKMFIPPHKSLVDDVHEDRLFDVWRKNPGVRSQEECMNSNDSELEEFASQLDATFEIIELRDSPIGFGFSWGRYGPQTVIRRHGSFPIFAVQKRDSFWKRLFKK